MSELDKIRQMISGEVKVVEQEAKTKWEAFLEANPMFWEYVTSAGIALAVLWIVYMVF